MRVTSAVRMCMGFLAALAACDDRGGGEEIPVSPDPDSIAESTAAVAGRVLDAETGEPVEAVVTVAGFPPVRATVEGAFVVVGGFEAATAYNIAIESPGYQRAETLFLAGEGKTSGVELALAALPPSSLVTLTPNLVFDSAGPVRLVSLANTGRSRQEWEIETTAGFLSVEPSSGSVDPGASFSLAVRVDATLLVSDEPALYGAVVLRAAETTEKRGGGGRSAKLTAVEYAIELVRIIAMAQSALADRWGQCDDEDPCTLDGPGPGSPTGCYHVRGYAMPCEDRDPCTVGDWCEDETVGGCVGRRCNDTNLDVADDCPAACSAPRCGDGFRSADEACDDGNDEEGDYCPPGCDLARCGDGFLFAALEECDDGNADETDSCLTVCALATCGDGLVKAGSEECDDGNEADTDACTSDCVAAACGDGFVHAGVEGCDDGNDVDTDACTSDCLAAACGDGLVQTGVEECDDDNAVEGDGCDTNCTMTACRNGIVTVGEACDDGNAVDDDGCSADCVAECPPGADFSADPLHCGACGHDCRGATCAAGLCEVQLLFATTTVDAKNIAQDDLFVYWTDDRSIVRAPKAGGASELVASLECSPAGLAVDATHLYWVNSDSSCPPSYHPACVMRKPKDTGLGIGLEVVSSGGIVPHGIALDATHVYWTDGGAQALYRIEKEGETAGGVRDTLASGQPEIWSLAVDATSVFFANAELCSSPCGYATPSGGGAIRQVPKGGGPVLDLALYQSQPMSLGIAGSHVYWINVQRLGPAGARVMRVSTGGGAAEVFWEPDAGSVGGEPEGLFVDDVHAIWSYTFGSRVYRRSTDGSDSALLLVETPGETPWAVTADATHAYFTTAAGRRVLAVAR